MSLLGIRSLLWHRLALWPGNFCMLQACPPPQPRPQIREHLPTRPVLSPWSKLPTCLPSTRCPIPVPRPGCPAYAPPSGRSLRPAGPLPSLSSRPDTTPLHPLCDPLPWLWVGQGVLFTCVTSAPGTEPGADQVFSTCCPCMESIHLAFHSTNVHWGPGLRQ